MKLAIASILASTAAAFAPSTFNGATSSALNMETIDDLSDLAKKLNPVVPRFDPLGLSTSNFWGSTEEETIGFLRESEVKHGRIAMFAFVGYIVHANGITWPWPMTMDGTPFPKVDNAPEAWDAIPDAAKLQIFAFVGFLEFVSELELSRCDGVPRGRDLCGTCIDDLMILNESQVRPVYLPHVLGYSMTSFLTNRSSIFSS
jgi:hypothetical protein